jgi:tRNA G37 N-methylase Trm5
MNLKQTLANQFPDLNPARLPGGFDRVGDIAVVGIAPEVETLEEEIGTIIIALHSNRPGGGQAVGRIRRITAPCRCG